VLDAELVFHSLRISVVREPHSVIIEGVEKEVLGAVRGRLGNSLVL
jgi:hypothetical protein